MAELDDLRVLGPASEAVPRLRLLRMGIPRHEPRRHPTVVQHGKPRKVKARQDAQALPAPAAKRMSDHLRTPGWTSQLALSPPSSGPPSRTSSAKPGPRTDAGACTGALAPATATGRVRTTSTTSNNSQHPASRLACSPSTAISPSDGASLPR